MDWTFYVIGIPLATVMIALMLLLAARHNKSIARETARELAAARQTGGAARARIVALRRAEIQRFRRQNLTTFKLLLEILPSDSQPAFFAGPVWELEPAALGELRPDAVVPVIFDRSNLRRIFPELPGAHYFQENQHALLGIENEFDPQAIIAAQAPPQAYTQTQVQPAAQIPSPTPAPPQAQTQPPTASFAPAPNTIYRKRSRTVLCGLPLWEVAFNVVNKKGRTRYVRQAKARAIVAIGDNAAGVVAIGGFAKGLIAVGQFSLGMISFGIFSVGLLASGLFGLGLLSLGVFGGGLLAIGAAFSGGYVAIGLLPVYARYEFGKDYQSPELLRVYEMLKSWAGMTDGQLGDAAAAAFIGLLAVSFGFFILSFVAQILAVQILEPNDNRLESPPC